MTPFTWFNWHEPVITPAQAGPFVVFAVVYFAVRFAIWCARAPKIAPEDPMSQPNGDVPHVGGSNG